MTASMVIPWVNDVCEEEIMQAADKGLRADLILRKGGEIDAWRWYGVTGHSAKPPLPLRLGQEMLTMSPVQTATGFYSNSTGKCMFYISVGSMRYANEKLTYSRNQCA